MRHDSLNAKGCIGAFNFYGCAFLITSVLAAARASAALHTLSIAGSGVLFSGLGTKYNTVTMTFTYDDSVAGFKPPVQPYYIFSNAISYFAMSSGDVDIFGPATGYVELDTSLQAAYIFAECNAGSISPAGSTLGGEFSLTGPSLLQTASSLVPSWDFIDLGGNGTLNYTVDGSQFRQDVQPSIVVPETSAFLLPFGLPITLMWRTPFRHLSRPSSANRGNRHP